VAGRALRKKILNHFQAAGGSDILYDRIASGETIASMARDFGCSRAYMSRTLNEVPDYVRALAKARKDCADTLVEEGLEMVDALGADSTTSEIAATREKVNFRKFMAGAYNAARYSTKPDTNVTLSISELHLDSIRKHNTSMKVVSEREPEQIQNGEAEHSEAKID